MNLFFLLLAIFIMIGNVAVAMYKTHELFRKENDIYNIKKMYVIWSIFTVLLFGFLIGYISITVFWIKSNNYNSHMATVIAQIFFWGAIFAGLTIGNVISLYNVMSRDRIYKLNDLQMSVDAYVDSIPGGVHHCVMNPKLSVSYVSEGFTNITGYTTKDMVEKFNGRYIDICYEKCDQDIVVDAVKHIITTLSSANVSYRILHKNGQIIWISETMKAVKDMNGVTHVFAVLTDVTAEKIEAETDGLTGLLNKRAFVKRTTDYLESNINNKVGMFMVDLDFFKSINDKYGHSNGDIALKMTADFLRNELNNNDCLIARIGGDEFVVLIKDVDSEDAMKNLQTKLYQAFNICIPDLQLETSLTGSIGYVFADCVDGYDCIYHKADLAMYKEKEARHAIRKK